MKSQKKHLNDLQNQRAELDEAIDDLTEQLDWAAKAIAAFENGTK